MAGNILGGCLFESELTIWCSSLLEDARAILSVQNLLPGGALISTLVSQSVGSGFEYSRGRSGL